MKKILIFLLVIAMIPLSFSACSEEESNNGSKEGEENKTVTLELNNEAEAILEKYGLAGGTLYRSDSQTPGEYLDEDLIRGYYGDAVTMPDFSCVEAYAVYIDETKPIMPCEFGIFKIADEAKAEEFMVYLRARIDKKIQNSIAYPTMDTTMLKSAVFEIRDGYLWYIAVKDANTEINDALKAKLDA